MWIYWKALGASKSFISPTYEVTFNTIANKHSLPFKHIWSIVKNPRGIRRWAVCKNPEEKRRCGFTVRARVSLGMKDGGLEESALAPAAICINTAQLPRAGSSLPSPGGADGYSTAYPGYTERWSRGLQTCQGEGALRAQGPWPSTQLLAITVMAPLHHVALHRGA